MASQGIRNQELAGRFSPLSNAPKAFTLRASEEDQAVIVALREYTRSATNSKAIWQAVREYVNRCEELADLVDLAERRRRENEALKARIAD